MDSLNNDGCLTVDNKNYIIKQFNVHPVPAWDYIEIPVSEGELLILDAFGREIAQDNMKGSNRIDIQDLKPGNYVVLVSSDGITYIGEFIKQN